MSELSSAACCEPSQQKCILPNDKADFQRVGNQRSDPAIADIPQNASYMNIEEAGYGCRPGISHNRFELLSLLGKQVRLLLDEPGKAVAPNNSNVSSTTAGTLAFVAWVAQLNLTYPPLTIAGQNQGYTYQPASEVYASN